MLTVSQSAASFLSVTQLESFNEPADMDSTAYIRAKSDLVDFAERYRIMFVYYYRLTPEGLLQPIIDNDLTDESYSLATEPLPMEEGVERALAGEVVTPGIAHYSEGFEGLLSAYAPIYDADGNVVAVAGVDISDQKVLDENRLLITFQLLLALSVFSVTVTGVLALVFQLLRERFLREQLQRQQLIAHTSRSFLSNNGLDNLIDDALRACVQSLKASQAFLHPFDSGIDNQHDQREGAYNQHDSAYSQRDQHEGAHAQHTGAHAQHDSVHDQHNRASTYSWPPLKAPLSPKLTQVFAVANHQCLAQGAAGSPAGDVHTDPDINSEPLAATDTVHFDGGRYATLTQLDNIRAFIACPVFLEGDPWGVLLVVNRARSRKWSPSDVNMVSSVATAISGAIARDKIDEERRAAMDEALSASRAKGMFLSNMSHEMRTPMNAIIGMSTIGLSSPTSERKDYCLQKISEASTSLLAIINDVLDMSKIEANKLEVSPISFDFRKLIDGIVDVMRFKTNEKQQELVVDIDPAIPDYLYNDDQRLSQVITNLLSNANKFTPAEGTITLRAQLMGISGDRYDMELSVTDTGIGINEVEKGRLFQSFEQANASTSRQFGGTGLGLAISKRIVELLGGTIWVESQVGCGSTFFVRFSSAKGYSTPSSAPEQASKMGDFSGINLLLAEDIEVNREIFLALMENSGINIDTVENGRQAVEAFKQRPERYDIIFMDIQMPEMDGLEATRQIRALDFSRAQHIPIVAMTANVFSEDINTCLAAGMDAHLGKPLDVSKITSILARFLPKKGPGAKHQEPA
jgi:signal transduction histidine kinase/CheY-like chemotaxis protein